MQLISNLSRKLFNKSDFLLQSLIKLNFQLTPTLLFPSATFISADNIDLSTAQIVALTHHSHTYAICQKQNITYVVLNDTKHLHDSSATIIKERLIHKSCFEKMKISIKQTQLLNLTSQQKLTFSILKYITKTKKEKQNFFKHIL